MKEPITYSEREQTPAQRQELIDNARAWSVAQGAVPGPFAEGVYARYVAGELTLQDITDELKGYYANRAASRTATTDSSSPSSRSSIQPEETFLS